MPKYYTLVHKKNKKEHVVNQETYDALAKRKHLINYNVKSEGEVSADKNKYIPAEVKSMKSMAEKIKEDSTDGSVTAEPQPENITSAKAEEPAKPEAAKNTGRKK